VNRLRNRLIAAFFAATVLPLAATIWITTSLLDRSLGYATTGELDRLSRTLEATVRQFYQREREALKQDVLTGRATPTTYPVADAASWPETVRAFWESRESDRFGLSGAGGDHVNYLRRRDVGDDSRRGVVAYSRDLRGIRMERLSTELRQTRQFGIDRGTRSAARVHPHAALAARRGVARLAGAAGADRASDQSADRAAHGWSDRFCRR
jgi:hypothetical protein